MNFAVPRRQKKLWQELVEHSQKEEEEELVLVLIFSKANTDDFFHPCSCRTCLIFTALKVFPTYERVRRLIVYGRVSDLLK